MKLSSLLSVTQKLVFSKIQFESGWSEREYQRELAAILPQYGFFTMLFSDSPGKRISIGCDFLAVKDGKTFFIEVKLGNEPLRNTQKVLKATVEDSKQTVYYVVLRIDSNGVVSYGEN